MPTFARSMRPRLAAASLLAILAAGCGGAGDSGWYYHWNCNGDSECLATNPGSQASGTTGPISGDQAGCDELMTFGTHFWGIPPATQSCDQNSSGGNGSAPTISGFSPASTAPGNPLTISGTNFPTAISGIIVTINGVGCTVTSATSTQIICTIGSMGNFTGTFTVTTAGGNATSGSSLSVVNHFFGVTSSGTQSVAVGGNGSVVGSTDGATWRGITLATPNFLSAIAWSGARFTTVGQAGTIVTTSPDGISWLTQTSGTTEDLFGVSWSSSLSLFAAVGRGGVVLTSPDGVTWTRRTSPTTNTLAAVAWCGAQFIAAGNGGVILTSANGVAWTSQSSSTTNFLEAIGCSSTLIVVGEGSDTTNGGVLTSPDGVTWTQRALSNTDAVFGVVWSGSQFVAVGVGGTIHTSPAGTVWTARSSGTTRSLNAVSWSTARSQFAAVGGFGTILTSSDGLTWTPRTP